MKILKAAVLLAAMLPFAASAADLGCSIKAKKKLEMREYEAMAKVTADQARKTALDRIQIAGSVIRKGGLEVEDGCLVYSYDVQVPGKKGVEEVLVDAGTGKVLKVEHESIAKEKLETAADKMSGKKPAPK